MSILAKIFGSSDVISKGLDLIDSFHTSETESIEAKAKAKTDLLKAYAPFKIAQRYLAFMFGGTYLLSFVLVLGLALAGKIEESAVVKDILLEFRVGEIMLIIIVFYFGGGFAEGALSARKNKD